MADKTKVLIEKTFLELLAERPIAKISVKYLTERCGVNRNTFYYHYKGIPQLTESIVEQISTE